jgi:DNA-binding response OmpR family regulator
MVVEDEEHIRSILKKMIEKNDGFKVVSLCGDFASAISDFIKLRPDVVFMDIDLKGESGLECAKAICEVEPKVKIVFATAHSEYMANAFEIYAFDYLVKPFSYIELLARIKALLRRNTVYNNASTRTGRHSEEWVTHGSIKINTNKNEVFIDEKELTLTETEYQILLLLAGNPGKTYSVQELYESVWDELYRADSANTVMVHIRKLRTKLEKNPQEPQIILTVWGKGYKIG